MKFQAADRYVDRPYCLLVRIFLIYLMVPIGWVGITENRAFCKEKTNSGLDEYGIFDDSYQVVKDVIKRNQNLSKILLAYNVPYAVIDAVAKKSKNVFDVRRFKAGNPYSVISQPGSDLTPRYFVYEQDPVNFVVYNLADPDVYRGNKPVEINIREASGGINGSLYKTFSRLGLDHDLFEKLSDLYAWTIDFHHLQKGDRFRIIYEQEYVGETPVGLGKILAAKFTHCEADHYAFYFKQQGKGGYYDENGNSMQKAFLKAPLKYTRITSRPSRGRMHPILKIRKRHLGTDYAAPMGTPIYSVGDGVVIKSAYHRSNGKHVTIRHSKTYKSEYLHMSRIKKGIKPGVQVHRGNVIGYVGMTGLATGPHLDFRLWKNGRIFNHINKNLPVDKSLKKEYISTFQKQTAALKARLNSIQLSRATSEPKQTATGLP